MEFSEKSDYCAKLASSTHVDADKELLRKFAPDDSLLNGIGNDTDFDKQILWVLLDHCPPEEIKEYRSEKNKAVPEKITSKVTPVIPKKKSKKSKSIRKFNGIIWNLKRYRKPS